ncbi:predicted protein [Histoplasma capsulatum var. duboisii H88]|uniref:Predicted protein n=1 Tax=Ajellomyces capsulatus (strain H88) TaxID=544711 RepID=F0UGL0_AJEC8|nr:predicted protein [Histoplasma capsulatum var. duboisii H88]
MTILACRTLRRAVTRRIPAGAVRIGLATQVVTLLAGMGPVHAEPGDTQGNLFNLYKPDNHNAALYSTQVSLRQCLLPNVIAHQGVAVDWMGAPGFGNTRASSAMRWEAVDEAKRLQRKSGGKANKAGRPTKARAQQPLAVSGNGRSTIPSTWRLPLEKFPVANTHSCRVCSDPFCDDDVNLTRVPSNDGGMLAGGVVLETVASIAGSLSFNSSFVFLNADLPTRGAPSRRGHDLSCSCQPLGQRARVFASHLWSPKTLASSTRLSNAVGF